MKKEKKSNTTNLIYKWNPKEMSVIARPENVGKEITDNNPYIQLDVDQFDYYSEIKPLDVVPDILSKNPLRTLKLERDKIKTVTGKSSSYLPNMIESFLRAKIELQMREHQKISKHKEDDLSILKEQIRKFAKSKGYICGFTKVDRRYISGAKDNAFPYDTAIVLGMEMEKKLVMEIPNPGSTSKKLFDFEAYEKSGQEVFNIVKFIRSKGYKCIACVPHDGMIKYPPHAVNAGLGNYGTQGLVITKEFGSRVRWTMISIDADIEPDAPKNLYVEEFCSRCRLCQKSCPGNAIPKEASYWRGAMKRRINDKRCWPYFKKNNGCGICIKVCPFNNLGYEKCMKSLPIYFKYDSMRVKKTLVI